MKSLELRPVMDVDQHINQRAVVAAGLGPGLDVWLAAQDATSTLVLRYPGGNPVPLLLQGVVRPFTHVQPIPREEILLWDSTPGAPSPVFDGKGRPVRELGAISDVVDVQTTREPSVIVAAGAALRVHVDGRVDTINLDQPVHALNVDEVSTSHVATRGMLTSIFASGARSEWKLPVETVSAFAIQGGRAVLLHDGNRLTSVGLGRKRAQVLAAYALVVRGGAPLVPQFRQGRGGTLFMMAGARCFKLTVDDVAEL